jgi:hypothetical protein
MDTNNLELTTSCLVGETEVVLKPVQGNKYQLRGHTEILLSLVAYGLVDTLNVSVQNVKASK